MTERLRGAATVVDEVHGFRYFDRRDLLGFVDGTENPVGPAVARALLVGDDDPDFAGGSYVVIQKYLHDLPAWNAMSVEQQEAAVGREKLSDIELPDDQKAARRAHRADQHRGRGRHRAADPARQHAVRQRRRGDGAASTAPTSSATRATRP